MNFRGNLRIFTDIHGYTLISIDSRGYWTPVSIEWLCETQMDFGFFTIEEVSMATGDGHFHCACTKTSKDSEGRIDFSRRERRIAEITDDGHTTFSILFQRTCLP